MSQQKIVPKPGGGLTQGHVDLMQFAITSIRDCTGINLELLGQKDINQPGILEAQRKQAGMTVHRSRESHEGRPSKSARPTPDRRLRAAASVSVVPACYSAAEAISCGAIT